VAVLAAAELGGIERRCNESTSTNWLSGIRDRAVRFGICGNALVCYGCRRSGRAMVDEDSSYFPFGGILLVLATLALEKKVYKALVEETLPTEPDRAVLLLNSDVLPGREITEILGLVQGHTVFAVWLGKDLSAIVRLILGGELTEYTEMMGNARSTATKRIPPKGK